MSSDDLLRPSVLKALCARAGIRPDRKSGQNFLVNGRTLDRIVATVDPQPGDTILEVGAGFGVLTLALAERGARIIAVERDRRITPILRELVAPLGNVEVVEGDVLRLLQTRPLIEQRWTLAANLPYSITSDFLRLLFDMIGTGALSPPQRAVLLLQREVVDRLTDVPGTRGLLTIITQLHCSPRRIARVPPAHFWPAPKVESAVVILDAWRSPSEIEQILGGIPRERFLTFVRSAFAHPRRQLIGNLRAATMSSRAILEQQLHAVGIDPGQRPETLTIATWIALARQHFNSE